MRFVKGMIWGTLLTAGTMMVCSEGVDQSKKKMIKKGKQFVRKLGMN